QKQPSVCTAIRSAWTGQRPVPTQPLETRPYTTIRDPSLHGQGCERRGPSPPGVRLRSLSRVGSERPISHFSQKRREMGHPGCTPARCFREKHAEPKAQDVIVASLQDCEALGEKQERLGGAAGMGCGKTPGSKFHSTPRK